ncbi:MAG: LytTR family DNA-binding domain-containing protein [Bacteroidota bacterium]
MLKTIIVDDDLSSCLLLSKLLETYCPEVQLLDTAADMLMGIKAIKQHQPDLVFLDIQLPEHSGFQLLNFFETIDFEVIFVSSFQDFAIQAFQASAIGYLLKPVQVDALQKAVQKVRMIKKLVGRQQRFELIKEQLDSERVNRIVFPAVNSLLYINLSEIIFLESDGRNTLIHLLQKEAPLKSTTSLKENEQLLANNSFLRVHRSFIINMVYIQKLVKRKDMHVLMENGAFIDIGPNYKDTFLEAINFFTR